jgi:acylphosphatase
MIVKIVMPTRNLIIRGKVQGVFYRATAREVADKMGLSGWVKNTPEGHVEILVSGPADHLDEFIAWCQRGPGQAVVTGVSVQEVPDQQFEGFRIKKDRFF